MLDAGEQPLNTPEALVNLPWVETVPNNVTQLRGTATRFGLRLPEKLVALRGGRILEPEGVASEADGKYLAAARTIAVIPATEGESSEFNRLVYFPTEERGNQFDANLTAYRGGLAAFIAENWDTTEGPSPIPTALVSQRLGEGEDAPFVTVTEYRPGIRGLGEGGSAAGVHQLDIHRLPLSEISRLLKILDRIHVPSEKFQEWTKSRNFALPEKSWLNPTNAKCALRGQEWWINPDTGQDDRLKELQRASGAQSVKELYVEAFPENNFPALLESMTRNNLALYPHQDGTVDGPELVGKLVVVHGTLYPDNIHMKLDPESGRTYYTITGGDRTQAFGLRGQMIDWLVSSCASSPEHQKALIDEFLKLHPDEKERRGLAMHVMYRSIMEAPWFAEQGKMAEAKNLIQLAHDILNAKDIWTGVNTPLTKQPLR